MTGTFKRGNFAARNCVHAPGHHMSAGDGK